MDERKNVKVVDEHGIDRVANVICSVDVDGTDYVLYFIKRDEENDNLFISKLIKNNDATFNMVNIEDSMEKGKLVEVVKELIKFAVDTDLDKTTGSVTLSNGKTVTVSNVLFNREQNINVSKTYVTTVKRAVTKVGEKFYSTESATTPTPVVEAVPEAPVVSTPVQAEMAPEVPTVDMPVLEPAMPEVPEEPAVVEAAPADEAPELVLPDAIVAPETKTEEAVPVAVSAPEVPSTPVVETVPETPVPSAPEAPAVVEPILPEAPSAPVVETPAPSVPETPAVVEAAPVAAPAPSVPEAPVAVEPILPEAPSTPVVETPAPSVVETPAVVEAAPVATPNAPDKLVFDGSKETNLNVALGEASQETAVSVPDVEPIREFGQDEPTSVTPVINVETPAPAVTEPAGDDSTPGNAGFANNKFFMVVAISFFLAACVFLGYEVVKYFQIVS